ncbi:glycoside hydrolase [Bacillaceae bacterium SIJ1]|uniref:glycoside hydrolase family 38 N-terminal domain-containing protein n=1 Tax=Litoribacterium kuwaitense TaxID=1398745 RepID=UPI0013EB14F3|nr:glycoside hydrolase [Litoribacterium kuwaitense]NGP45949.1 glycoside hydrolase [Litoribacterium kuwaitense]
MKQLNRKWRIYAIHHSHTDIGYTERQERIEQYHIDFIRQAIAISKDIRSGVRPERKGFKWTCETFWAVEQFLKEASEEEKKDFAEAVRQGDIELSGTYLNMTELAGEDLLRSIHQKAADYGKSIGVSVDSAMTADINGYSWGYAQSLLDVGVKHLFSCIHTHHGMFPLGRKQMPFWWETPAGERLLVWNGEHYMIGNELGLCPDGVGRYMIRDEFHTPAIVDNHDEVMTTRIERYLKKLEEEGYPYDFVPVMVSGLATDNGSPNGDIMQVLNAWNEKHGEQVQIEMTTLSQFFKQLKVQKTDIPVYRGDWPDWWSDGVASTPMQTQIFKDGQRALRKVKALDPDENIISAEEREKIEHQLVMYAEHTWGYHASIHSPWDWNVQMLEVRKLAYAANASRLAHHALDKLNAANGGALLHPGRAFRYQVMNTESQPTKQLVELTWNGFENARFSDGLEVVEEQSGKVVPHQTSFESATIEVDLQPGEQKHYFIRPVKTSAAITTSNVKLVGADTIYDIDDIQPSGAGTSPFVITEHSIESPYVKLTWSGEGIDSWIDKASGEDLLRTDRKHNAFSPVYEVTPATDPKHSGSVFTARSTMGRNRKGLNVQRSVGQLVKARALANGPLFGTVELQFEVDGMSYYSLFLKVYASSSRVDVAVRLHKESVWEPENVYISLPFMTSTKQDETLYFDKAGANVRPWVDQLPGTLLDYYCIQDGMAFVGEERSLMIATPDTPLVQLGSLERGTRLLHTQQKDDTERHVYSWAMSNYWETNFKATLGGFYEFRYLVDTNSTMNDAQQAIGHCQTMSSGLTVWRMNAE